MIITNNKISYFGFIFGNPPLVKLSVIVFFTKKYVLIFTKSRHLLPLFLQFHSNHSNMSVIYQIRFLKIHILFSRHAIQNYRLKPIINICLKPLLEPLFSEIYKNDAGKL